MWYQYIMLPLDTTKYLFLDQQVSNVITVQVLIATASYQHDHGTLTLAQDNSSVNHYWVSWWCCRRMVIWHFYTLSLQTSFQLLNHILTWFWRRDSSQIYYGLMFAIFFWSLFLSVWISLLLSPPSAQIRTYRIDEYDIRNTRYLRFLCHEQSWSIWECLSSLREVSLCSSLVVVLTYSCCLPPWENETKVILGTH